MSPGLVIEREIGAGSMGAVFLGHDPALDRDVAIKVLRPEMAGAVGAERFRREARLLARLRHPHVVPVHQAGEADGLFYFVMEMVRGETLQARLSRGPLPHEAALAIVRDLLDALGAAHQLGIVHRDVKPANIFLGDQGAMLADFGIAKMEPGPESEPLTDHAREPGTPGYMAPEQAAGGHAVPQSDLYAVGMVLYECLTGHRWITSADPARADWRGVPPRVVPALRRALLADPRQRWRTAAEFHRALTRRRKPWVLLSPALLVAAVAVWWIGRSHTPVDVWSPGPALPRNAAALREFRQAERYYRQGRWREADTGYRAALLIDPTCLICEFRLTDIDRWLDRPRNTDRQDSLARQASKFPLHYALLVAADTAHQLVRLRLLKDVTDGYLDFPLGRYLYGEELFNRGPLFGHDRSEAIEQLEQATKLDPDFAPPWVDLLLARIAERDSAGAVAAQAQLERFGAAEGLAGAQRELAKVAFSARFGGSPTASVESALTDATVARLPQVAAGPRLLAGLGSPAGAVEVGRAFETFEGQRIVQRSGLVAQMIGHAALGQIGQMRAAAARLVASSPNADWRVFAAQLEAALVLAEPSPAAQALAAARDTLSVFLLPGYSPGVRRAAGWMLEIIAARGHGVVDPGSLRPWLEERASPLPVFLRASRQGAGDAPGALDATARLDVDLELWDRERDPFMRAIFKLSRAGWLLQIGNTEAAREEYRWHEHFNLPIYPTDTPVPSDGDWALATIANWRLARMLDHDKPGPELCAAYRAVVERWSQGDEPYRARADSARTRSRAIGCPLIP